MLMNTLFGESLFDEFFNDFPKNFGALVPSKKMNLMSTDVMEKDGAYELDIDMPGYKKDEVKAELKDGYLTVSAIKSSNMDDENGKYIRRERYYGSCSRSFYVGDDLTESEIKARFEDGILKLMIPKKEPEIEQPRYISIEG